jgi:hypothetical protein
MKNHEMKLGEQFVDPFAQDLIKHHVQPYLLAFNRVLYEVELGLTPRSKKCFVMYWQQHPRYTAEKGDH